MKDLEVSIGSVVNMGEVDNIEFISLLYHNDDVILLHVDLTAKRKEMDAYYQDGDVLSMWLGGDEIRINLPEGFRDNIAFCQTSRYTLHICIYRYSMMDNPTNILWQRPEK